MNLAAGWVAGWRGRAGYSCVSLFRKEVRRSVVVQVPAVCRPVEVAMLPLHAVIVVGE